MNLYTTTIRAIDPTDGGLKTWSGPKVPGISFSDAEQFCQNNSLGYCKVDGVFIGEVSQEDLNWEPGDDVFKLADRAGVFDNYKKGLN